MIQNLHFEKVSIWLQIDRNPYMVADNRELWKGGGSGALKFQKSSEKNQQCINVLIIPECSY